MLQGDVQPCYVCDVGGFVPLRVLCVPFLTVLACLPFCPVCVRTVCRSWNLCFFFQVCARILVCFPYVCVFIIQGHSLAPHGSIPYPGCHGYRGHLSQRVPADQTGVHPDDVSPPRRLLGTFVEHNAQVLVADSENQRGCKNVVLLSQSELVCVCVPVLAVVERGCFLRVITASS